MTFSPEKDVASLGLLAGLLLGGGALLGLAWALWMDHGAEIYLALVQSGLAWCL